MRRAEEFEVADGDMEVRPQHHDRIRPPGRRPGERCPASRTHQGCKLWFDRADDRLHCCHLVVSHLPGES